MEAGSSTCKPPLGCVSFRPLQRTQPAEITAPSVMTIPDEFITSPALQLCTDVTPVQPSVLYSHVCVCVFVCNVGAEVCLRLMHTLDYCAPRPRPSKTKTKVHASSLQWAAGTLGLVRHIALHCIQRLAAAAAVLPGSRSANSWSMQPHLLPMQHR